MAQKTFFDDSENEDTRDLRFIPADPDSARSLSAAQVEQFNRDGFLSGLSAFEAPEILRIRDYFDDLIENVLSADDRRNSYSINAYHLVCAGVYDLLLRPELLDYVEDLLGPDFACWGNKYIDNINLSEYSSSISRLTRKHTTGTNSPASLASRPRAKKKHRATAGADASRWQSLANCSKRRPLGNGCPPDCKSGAFKKHIQHHCLAAHIEQPPSDSYTQRRFDSYGLHQLSTREGSQAQ